MDIRACRYNITWIKDLFHEYILEGQEK